jgi:hypothetical protein
MASKYGPLINNEMGRTWIETVGAYICTISRIRLDRVRKNNEKSQSGEMILEFRFAPGPKQVTVDA